MAESIEPTAPAPGPPEINPFEAYVRRLREGDASALEELIDRYAPIIRLEARVRLRSPKLRSLLDSDDICQSVLKSFFSRVAAGQFAFERPEDLRRLLVQMACNKSRHHLRRHLAGKRDIRRSVGMEPEDPEPIGREDEPGAVVEWEELVARARGNLTAEEQSIAEARHAGRSWREIAEQLGLSEDQCRMRFTRTRRRIARELELEDDDG